MRSARWLADKVGGPVDLKCENLQRAGSFKIRGAYTRIARLSEAERARGVVAASAGNHAQGVALAARLLGVPAAIVMPDDAPPVKLAATRGYGAEVIVYDRLKGSREEIATKLLPNIGKRVGLLKTDTDFRIKISDGAHA